MVKLIAMMSVVGVVVLGAPRMALAGGGHDHGDHDRDDRHGAAPEPMTIIGLALGAGAIGVARWVSKRKKTG